MKNDRYFIPRVYFKNETLSFIKDPYFILQAKGP